MNQLISLLFALTALFTIAKAGTNRVETFIEQENEAQNRSHKVSTPQVAAAFGKAVISNRCGYDVYLWAVSKGRDPQTPTKIKSRSAWSEQFTQPCGACGTSYKISKSTSNQGGFGGVILQFEYAIDHDQIYYDMSFVDCVSGNGLITTHCPGHEAGLRIYGTDGSCAPLHCKPNDFCLLDAYYVDDPKAKWGLDAPVKGCAKGRLSMDVHFLLCSN